ncbi:MAG TPA: hypothetical protein VGK54_01910, partial [Chloroflexota bacterium]
MTRQGWLWVAALGLAVSACSPAAPSGRDASAGAETGSRSSGQTLVLGLREPSTLTTRPLGESGAARTMIRDLFNAQLAQRDERGEFRPWLAESLPQLNTDSWRVLADGRMETTY